MHVSKVGYRQLQKRQAELKEKLRLVNEEGHTLIGCEDDAASVAWRQELAGTTQQLADIKAALNEQISFIDDEVIPDGIVARGSEVLLDYGDGEPERVVILGPVEVKFGSEEFISYESPISKVIIGARVGSTVMYEKRPVKICSSRRWHGLEPAKTPRSRQQSQQVAVASA